MFSCKSFLEALIEDSSVLDFPKLNLCGVVQFVTLQEGLFSLTQKMKQDYKVKYKANVGMMVNQ